MSPKIDADYGLWQWLSRTRDAIFRARVKELHKYGILIRQSGVMFIIQTLGGNNTPAEISRWILRESHTVSGILQRMAEDGLIIKTVDKERRNLVRVKLSKKGLKAYHMARELDSIHNIMSVLSESERKQLRKLLEKLWYRSLAELRIDSRPPFPSLE